MFDAFETAARAWPITSTSACNSESKRPSGRALTLLLKSAIAVVDCFASLLRSDLRLSNGGIESLGSGVEFALKLFELGLELVVSLDTAVFACLGVERECR
ncbi:hypothetical protein ACNQVK_03205 [Mycobacterium sp. 134]|uniref:hypothetical protein n=1 Tax=Mycobacterium sp. 134 TaxID=3400425 RepID=UPI003AADA4B5